MKEEGHVPPYGPYRRQIEGADFSLEARTSSVPDDGCFYILKGGEVLLRTEDFAEAEQQYRELCRAHWKARLTSADPQQRRMGALGLLSLDPDDPAAGEVLKLDGTPEDRKRVEQARNRARYQTGQAGKGRRGGR